MTDYRSAAFCDHFASHRQLRRVLKSDVAVEYYLCEECGGFWVREREELYLSEELELLDRALHDLGHDILRAFGLR